MLLPRIIYCIGRAAPWRAVANRQNEAGVVDEPAVALEHTILGVVSADINRFVALGKNVKISLALFDRPLIGLSFERQHGYEPN